MLRKATGQSSAPWPESQFSERCVTTAAAESNCSFEQNESVNRSEMDELPENVRSCVWSAARSAVRCLWLLVVRLCCGLGGTLNLTSVACVNTQYLGDIPDWFIQSYWFL